MNIRHLTQVYLTRIAITFFLFVLLGYISFQSRHLLLGPIISIESPTTEASIFSPLIEIKGRAQNVSKITLNDRPIFTDEEGRFQERLLLPRGYTIMTLEAEDRFGRSTKKTLRLVRN